MFRGRTSYGSCCALTPRVLFCWYTLDSRSGSYSPIPPSKCGTDKDRGVARDSSRWQIGERRWQGIMQVMQIMHADNAPRCFYQSPPRASPRQGPTAKLPPPVDVASLIPAQCQTGQKVRTRDPPRRRSRRRRSRPGTWETRNRRKSKDPTPLKLEFRCRAPGGTLRPPPNAKLARLRGQDTGPTSLRRRHPAM